MIVVITHEFNKSLRKLNNREVNIRVLETIENIEMPKVRLIFETLKNSKVIKLLSEFVLETIALVFIY